MKNNDDIPKDVREKFDEYSKKSEEQLIKELLGSEINREEFESFCTLLEPLLTPEQKKKLGEIGKITGKRTET